MKFKSKRILSTIMAFAMTVSSMVLAPVAAQAADKMVDVWDFGAVAEADTTVYRNNIDMNFLENFTVVSGGKFTTAGTYDLGSGLSVATNANDRMYNTSSRGLENTAIAMASYEDGYTANGQWYANGTGGATRRYFTVNLGAGDRISVYTGSSNADAIDVTLDNGTTQKVKNVAGGADGRERADLIADNAGEYKIWFGGSGKPTVNRIVKYPAATVSGNIDLAGNPITDYTVSFKNDITGDIIPAVLSGNTYTAELTPGYSFTAMLSGAVGYGFTNKTKLVTVEPADVVNGKTQDLAVEVKAVYDVTGSIKGFDSAYNLDNLVLKLVPSAESMADTVTAELDKAAMTYKATLEPDVPYTVTLEGVNDYEVTEGGTINNNKTLVNNITVALKAKYNINGFVIGCDVDDIASKFTFTNMDDGYTYSPVNATNSNEYTIWLRDGNYAISTIVEGYTTSTHIAVAGKNVYKDILLVPTTITPPTVDTSVKDIYVGCEGKPNNFDTMTEAMAAAAVFNPQSEADRVTVHIAPGVYREQISVDTPYLTFVKEGEGEVKLTWYYGIGYEYYSADSKGYYNRENAFDKFDRHPASKWGTAVYVKETANGFKAEGITFENSFNKYITDEEIADGVKETGILPVRNYATDVTSKAATERATAISIEGDNAEFKDCTFLGSQDTLYIGGKVTNHVYFKNCDIEGNTDYIFGSGNAVFDGCELRFAGYSDTATGGYITAGRSNNYDGYKGYLFRACSITNADGMKASSGYFGRPWDQNADITFLNCTVPSADTIAPEGWTSMSGATPEQAEYKEFGTTLTDGTPVDTSKRVAGTVLTDASAINPVDYFGGWTPTYYADDTLPVEFAKNPYFSTGGDVLLPSTGDTFKANYSLGANDVNDASIITYSLVAADGTETVIKSVTAASNTGVKLTKDMIGSKLKAVITPKTIMGNSGTAKSIITEKEITLGSGSVDTDRPSGKAVIFLAGDSTVKDYSAGAINNSGANRPEGSWGEFLEYFVDDNFEVMDYAQGGRSARGFINGTKDNNYNDKYFDKIKEQMIAGDYLFIQFGHNDSSESYADRYVPVGTPDENGRFPYVPQTDITDEGKGTFCWYLQEMVDAAKAVGATPVLVTPVSRMYFDADGKITPHHGPNDEYVVATKQVAEENNIMCIDLFDYSKGLYEDLYAVDGSKGVSDLATRLFAKGEKTHHSKFGGFYLAEFMAKTLKDDTVLGLSSHIVAPKSMYITDSNNDAEFVVDSKGVLTAYGRNADSKFDVSISENLLSGMANEILEYIAGKDTPTPPTPPVDEGVYGDANKDTEVTAADVVMVMQFVINGTPYTNDTEYVDVNKDGKVDSEDAAMILQKALNDSYTLPVA